MGNEACRTEFQDMLAARGVSRRDFMKLCGTIAVAAGLSELAAPKVAQALEKSVIGTTKGNLYPVIWIEGASCTGCTEAFAQVEAPDPASIVLEMISLNYSETLSAAAGHSMEEAKAQTIEAGNYILIYEGAVLEGWGGQALRVADMPGTEHLVEAAANANAVVALGSCAVNGGWMGANPNSSGAIGVEKYLEKAGITDVPVINIPGCPANPEWLVSVLVDVVLMDNTLPELDGQNKPVGIFGQTVHDNCERRGHFENGEFVYSSAPRRRPRATASTRLDAAGRRRRPTAVWSCTTTAAAGACRRARPASAAARPTRTTPARTGSRSTPRSTSAIATCASATGWSSPAPSRSASPASWPRPSSSTASA